MPPLSMTLSAHLCKNLARQASRHFSAQAPKQATRSQQVTVTTFICSAVLLFCFRSSPPAIVSKRERQQGHPNAHRKQYAPFCWHSYIHREWDKTQMGMRQSKIGLCSHTAQICSFSHQQGRMVVLVLNSSMCGPTGLGGCAGRYLSNIFISVHTSQTASAGLRMCNTVEVLRVSAFFA